MELNEETLSNFFTLYDSNDIRKYLVKTFKGKPFTFLSANINRQTMLVTKVFHFYGIIDYNFVEKNIVIIDSFYHATHYDSSIRANFTSAVNNIPIDDDWLISIPDDILIYMKLLNDIKATVLFLGSLFTKIADLHVATYDGVCFETRLDSIRSAETCIERLSKFGYVDSSNIRNL